MDSRLFDAILSGDIAAFRSLQAEDPLILDRISLNSTENPLHLSSLAGQLEITREVACQKPAFARELNQDGFSPIHIASSNGPVELARELLRVGYDICLLKGKDGKTPLHFAAMKGRVDIVQELVRACPQSVKEVTTCGETVLHVAVKSNQVEAVKVLLEEIKKLDMMEIVNWKDKDGNTIMHLATLRKQHETIRLLIGREAIAYGVEVNSINASGFTAKDVLDFILQSGGEYNDISILEMFQQAGAMKAMDITTNPASTFQVEVKNINKNVNHTWRNSRPWNLWKELKLEIEESSTETQNALMVVATLIATVTYQAILSPPSGFWSAESRRSQSINSVQKRDLLPGEAVMSGDPEVFAVFTVFNAVGFFASIAMISLLTSGFPLRAGLRLAILSMTATYVIAVIYMSPTERKTIDAVVWSVGLLVLAESARFMIWILKKWGVLPLKKTRTSADRNPAMEYNVTKLAAGANSPSPGGENNEEQNHAAARAIYDSQKTPFYVFLISNTLAFSSSLLVITSLTYGFPFHFEIWVATASMMVTYASAIYAVTPHESESEHFDRYTLNKASVPFITSWFKRFQYDKERDSPNDGRNVLLVIATLIAAVTFQAGVNPPGGLWQDDNVQEHHAAGRAIYASQKHPYYVFLMSNTLAFSASLLAGVNPPGGVWQDTGNGTHVAGTAIYASQPGAYYVFVVSNTMALSSCILVITSLTYRFPFHIEIWVATASMMVTYASAVFAVTPRKSVRYRYLLFIASVPFLMRCLGYFFKKYCMIENENQIGKKDSPNDARNALLVIATLIAAVTFQAGVNPSGGLWQDDNVQEHHAAGRAIYASQKHPYYVFLMSNTLAFSASLLVITSLTYKFPFHFEIWVATASMMAGVNPPGGVWQDDGNGTHVAGTAIYASQAGAYYVFVVSNTLALSTCILVITSLTYRFPFHIEIWVATASMMVTYASAVFAVTPRKSVRYRYLLIIASVPFVMRCLGYFFKKYCMIENENQIESREEGDKRVGQEGHQV
ncbi:hypothetical protein NC652_032539 [Populus alba x Populus x berolinensis]|nr:hypothetical protein NC652_032539 [Populus alba x Populus x berolinensis]